jgi:hypothetical protein
MVLQLEKKTSNIPQVAQPVVNETKEEATTSVEPMNPPVEEPVAKEEVSNTAAEKVAAAQQAIAQAQAGEPVEESPAPKKRKVSKKKTTTEETSEPESSLETTEVPKAETLNDVDPFSANTTDFNMFDTPAEPMPENTEPVMPMFEEEQAF